MAYTTGTEVAAAIGLTYSALPAEQQTLADLCSDAATAWLDRKTHRPFSATPLAVLGEIKRVDGPGVYLNHTPVTSIDAVRARPDYAGIASFTLQASTSYELLQDSTGLLLVVPLGDPVTAPAFDQLDDLRLGWLLSVDYHYGAAVPADLHLAALELASEALQVWLATDLRLYKSISIGQLNVSIAQQAKSEFVNDVIQGYRKVLIA